VIRPLRVRHRRTFAVLAVLLPILFALALALRPRGEGKAIPAELAERIAAARGER
jgi:hypothetical protein